MGRIGRRASGFVVDRSRLTASGLQFVRWTRRTMRMERLLGRSALSCDGEQSMKRISMAHSALVGTLAFTMAAQPLLVYAQNPSLAPVPDQRAQASLDGKFSLADALA